MKWRFAEFAVALAGILCLYACEGEKRPTTAGGNSGVEPIVDPDHNYLEVISRVESSDLGRAKHLALRPVVMAEYWFFARKWVIAFEGTGKEGEQEWLYVHVDERTGAITEG